MGIRNRDGALFMATGIDNTGMYEGKRDTIGIIKAMMGEITSFDVFSGLGISAATAFAKAAKSSYDFEKEFRKNMLEVATISTQVTDDMTGFMNQVMAITQEIPITAPEAAKALYQIVSAGHDGAAGMKVLEVSARSAIGGMTDTATAADAITTLINAYKLSAEDAEKVSDQLFTTARLGKTTFGELGQSIAQVAPIAASYGVEMDQVLAAVATLTKSGTPTAQAMTQIRASIIGTSKVLGDGAFNTRTFQEALAEIAAMAGGSESKLRELIPEVEAVNGVLGMTGIKAQDAALDLKAMNDSAGATEVAFQKMMGDVDKQMTLMSNNIQATLRPMGEAILKNVSEAAKTINHGFETGDMQNSLENMKKLLIGVAGAFVTYKSAAIGASTAEALSSAKVTISNGLKQIQNQITGESVLAKEKERVYQEAYNASLEKTITEEQRAKLAKQDLKSGSQEYMKALGDQALQEKKNADNLVESLTKSVAKNKEKLATAKENLDMSQQAVAAAKAEFDAAFEANDLAGVEIAQMKMNAAAKREEAAATNVSTTSKKLKSTESKLLTATTVAEVATTRVNTAITVADTAATNVASAAKNRLKVATLALGKAMKANPLGVILTLISLATTAYMLLADKIKATETAQSRFNKLNKAAAESIAEETAELNMLLSIAKNELVAKEEREKAIKKLNDISPEYLGNLSLENIRTKEATYSIDAYTKAIGRNAKAKALMDEMNPLYREQLKLEQELYALQKKSDDLKANKLGFSDEQLYYANLDISAQIKNKTAQKAEVDKQIQDVLDMYNDELTSEVNNNPIKVDIPVNIQLLAEQSNISALMKKKEEIEARINDKKGKGILVDAFDRAELDAVNNELKKSNDLLVSLNKEASKNVENEGDTILKRQINLTKELSEAETKLMKLREPDSKAKESDITTADNKVKEIKAKLETLTGVTKKEGVSANTLKSEQSDRLKAIEEFRKSMSEAEVQAELDIRQASIDAMESGSKKTLAQIDLDYDRQRDANRKRADEMIKERQELERKQWEYDNPKWKEKGMEFKPSTTGVQQLSKPQQGTLLAYDNLADVSRQKATKEYLEAERHAMNEYLKEYGSYLEKKQALTDSYNDKIAKAPTRGEKMSLKRESNEAMKELDLSEFKKSINFADVFGNLDKLSTDSVSKLRDKLKEYISKAAKDLKPEDLRDLSDALTNLDIKAAERNPFGEIGKNLEDYRKSAKGVEDAQERLNYVMAGGEIATGLYEDGTGKLCKRLLTQEEAEKDLAKAQDNRAESLALLNTSLQEGVQKAQEYLGVATAMVGALEDFGLEVPEQLTGFIDGMGKTLDSLASIDLTKPVSIIKGAIGVIGGLGKAIGSLFNNDGKKQKNIERLQKQIDTLDKSYDKLGDSIDKAFSKDASNLIGQQNQMLEQQRALIKQQIAEEESKKHSDDEKIQQYRDQLEEIDKTLADNKEKAVDAIFGEDLKSAIENFASAYAEAWASGEDKAKSAKDTVKNMMRQMVTESIKAAMESSKSMEMIRAKLQEFYADNVLSGWEQDYIYNMADSLQRELDQKFGWADGLMKDDMGTSLGIDSDSISSTIIEGLRSGKSGIKDFSDSFEDMMRTAVLNSLKTKYLEGPLKEFQKRFAELSESGGQLTEAEIEDLRDMYADIIEGANSQFDALKDISGLDFSVDSDNTLKGAYAKASQESIDLLAGQTGATRVALEDIKGTIQPIRDQMRLIYDLQREGWQDVRAIRELTVKIDRNTEQVARNTAEIKTVAGRISDNTRDTVEALEGTINVKVKM